jgi:hypothetical protein
MKQNFRQGKDIYICLAIIWLLCNLLSFIGFYLKYKTMVNLIEGVMANSLTAIFSLPEAMLDLVIFWDQDFSGTILFVIVYWGCVCVVLRRLFRYKKKKYFYILSSIFILSSFFWLYEAIGMIGI